ncbi:cation transporter [Tenacibaculum agarivorans]|uniref:cation transporter n=1 Tax=Tenacibaculum agarivorans TaxID=1908389 RepID=UPI00094BB756|nr:cation transporter [Tenacibaculum agarivorans]
MKISNIALVLLLSLITFSCKTATKEEGNKQANETMAAKAETVSLNISGMSCEVSCAKTIESKLAKKEGVLEAKVIFNDSLATVKYDANKINKGDLISVIEGIGGLYKASEANKKECSTDAKDECCATKKDNKVSCTKDNKKECCTTDKV